MRPVIWLAYSYAPYEGIHRVAAFLDELEARRFAASEGEWYKVAALSEGEWFDGQ